MVRRGNRIFFAEKSTEHTNVKMAGASAESDFDKLVAPTFEFIMKIARSFRRARAIFVLPRIGADSGNEGPTV